MAATHARGFVVSAALGVANTVAAVAAVGEGKDFGPFVNVCRKSTLSHLSCRRTLYSTANRVLDK